MVKTLLTLGKLVESSIPIEDILNVSTLWSWQSPNKHCLSHQSTYFALEYTIDVHIWINLWKVEEANACIWNCSHINLLLGMLFLKGLLVDSLHQ
jgi:hypothetical protein